MMFNHAPLSLDNDMPRSQQGFGRDRVLDVDGDGLPDILVGIEVNRLWDLLSFERPYPEAFPILLAHLQKPHRSEVLERLGRALGVPEARPLWPKLVELYRSATDEGAKTGLADAIMILAQKDKRLLDEVIALTKDPKHGPSRLFFIDVLARSRDPRAYATMVELKDDPDLYKEIAFRLKRAEYNARRRAKRRGQDLQ